MRLFLTCIVLVIVAIAVVAFLFFAIQRNNARYERDKAACPSGHKDVQLLPAGKVVIAKKRWICEAT